jgi:hypothetical protein
MKFWTNSHPLSPLADQMSEKFIPMMGSTKYIEAEVLRAIMKVHYDHFNNGTGGNNMSRQVEYVKRFYLGKATPAFEASFARIREDVLRPEDAPIDDDLEIVMAEIIMHLFTSDMEGKLTPIELTVEDMPSAEIIYPLDPDNNWDEDEEDVR